MKKVKVVGSIESQHLAKKVDELKMQETRDLNQMNRQYHEINLSRKNEDRNNNRIEELKTRMALQHINKIRRGQIWKAWKQTNADTIRLRKHEEYIENFARINRMRRAMNVLKLELGFTGNRLYKFKCEIAAEE